MRLLSPWDCDRGRDELEGWPMTREDRMFSEFIFPDRKTAIYWYMDRERIIKATWSGPWVKVRERVGGLGEGRGESQGVGWCSNLDAPVTRASEVVPRILKQVMPQTLDESRESE